MTRFKTKGKSGYTTLLHGSLKISVRVYAACNLVQLKR